MLVSHRKKFIYIKTIKTAGTSVELALQPYCIPQDMKVEVLTDAIETEAGIVGARGNRVSDQHWYNHMGVNQIRANLSPGIWEEYCKICNIRNPWDKTVSFFHMRFPEIKNEAPNLIREKFLSWISDTQEIGVDTRIYFIGGRPAADEYIRYDNLKADFEHICHILDLPPPAIPQIRMDDRGESKIPYQYYYDERIKERVATIYAKEIEFFGWSFE